MVLLVLLDLVVSYPLALPARSPAIDTACDLSRSFLRWLARMNIRSVQDLQKRLSSVCSVQPKTSTTTHKQWNTILNKPAMSRGQRDHNMSRISEIREVKKRQPPPGILFSTVTLYYRDETKCVIILLKKLMLCSLKFSIDLISLLTHRLQDCGPTS